METFTVFCFMGGFLCGVGFCVALMGTFVYFLG
jgi:hypothetical protein